MSSYVLAATHSITNDRFRRWDQSELHVRCTLTVESLGFQPLVATLLADLKKNNRLISVRDLTVFKGNYDSRIWTFTLVKKTDRREVRTRTPMGRQLSREKLEAPARTLLNALEMLLNQAWQKYSGGPSADTYVGKLTLRN